MIFCEQFADDPPVLMPQTAPCLLLDAGMLAGATHVLAGEPSAQNVHMREIRSIEAGHIIIIIYMHVRPVPREYGPGEAEVT
jgi:hypothetical protein